MVVFQREGSSSSLAFQEALHPFMKETEDANGQYRTDCPFNQIEGDDGCSQRGTYLLSRNPIKRKKDKIIEQCHTCRNQQDAQGNPKVHHKVCLLDPIQKDCSPHKGKAGKGAGQQAYPP